MSEARLPSGTDEPPSATSDPIGKQPQRTGSGVRRVAGNAFWFASADLIGKIASFVLAVVLARHLGATQYGYFNFAISFFPLFLMLTQSGLEVAVIRQLAERPQDVGRIYRGGLRVRLVTGLLAVGGGALILPLFVPGGASRLAVSIVGCALFLDEVSRFFASIFSAFEHMRVNAMVLLVNRIVSTALCVAVAANGGTLVQICLMYAAGSLAAVASAFFVLRRTFPQTRSHDATPVRMSMLLKAGGPYGLANFLNMGVFRIDAVMIEAIRGPVSVANYGVAYRFFEPLLFAAWSVASALLPRLAKRAGRRDVSEPFVVALAILLAFYLPVAVGAPFTAHWLVVTLFSQKYVGATTAAIWLTSAAVPYAIAHLARSGAIAVGKRTQITVAAAVTLALNIGLNAFAITRYGFVGAAVVTFITEIVEALILLVMFARAVGGLLWRSTIIIPVSASAFMGLVLLASGLRGASAFAVGAAVYLIALATATRVLGTPRLRSQLRSAWAR